MKVEDSPGIFEDPPACPLTRLIFFFLGADLVMMMVRLIEGRERKAGVNV